MICGAKWDEPSTFFISTLSLSEADWLNEFFWGSHMTCGAGQGRNVPIPYEGLRILYIVYTLCTCTCLA